MNINFLHNPKVTKFPKILGGKKRHPSPIDLWSHKQVAPSAIHFLILVISPATSNERLMLVGHPRKSASPCIVGKRWFHETNLSKNLKKRNAAHFAID
jgi:hypothetical protein